MPSVLAIVSKTVFEKMVPKTVKVGVDIGSRVRRRPAQSHDGRHITPFGG